MSTTTTEPPQYWRHYTGSYPDTETDILNLPRPSKNFLSINLWRVIKIHSILQKYKYPRCDLEKCLAHLHSLLFDGKMRYYSLLQGRRTSSKWSSIEWKIQEFNRASQSSAWIFCLGFGIVGFPNLNLALSFNCWPVSLLVVARLPR